MYIFLCLFIGALTLYYGMKTFQTGSFVSIQFVLSTGVLFLFLNSLLDPSDIIYNDYFLCVLFVAILGVWFACSYFPLGNQSFGLYRIKLRRRSKIIYYNVKERFLNIATAIYVLQVIYTGYYVIKTNGLLMVLLGGRSEQLGYDNGINSSTSLILNKGLELLLYINIARLYKKGNRVFPFLLVLFPIAYLYFVAQTRFDILTIFIAYLVFIVENRNITKTIIQGRRISLLSLRSLFLGSLGLLFAIWFMSAANMWRGGLGYGLDLVGSTSVLDLLRNSFPSTGAYFEYFYSVVEAVDKGVAKLEYGINWTYYNFINFIPRSLWDDKPITSINGRLTYLLYPNEKAMCTFTLFGEGYLQFGMLGVFMESFVLLYSKYIVLRMISNVYNSELFRIICIVNLLTYTRSNAPIFEAMIYLLVIYVLKKFLSKKVVWNTLSC